MTYYQESNFKHMLIANSKEDIITSDIYYPCVILVAPDTKEAVEEAADICFTKTRLFWTDFLPSIVLLALGIIFIMSDVCIFP